MWSRPRPRAALSTLAAAALVAVSAPCLQAQQSPGELTLDRIFNSREFSSDGFGPARWLEDGSGYTTVEPSSSVRGLDIVRYDPASGSREVLVAAADLVPAGQSSPLIVENYEWSSDGGKLLIYTNSKRVWRYNTRGDYWVLDLKSGMLQKLGGDVEPSTLMFAKFSPQGDRVAYVHDHDLYDERLSDGHITRLTEGGSLTLINGTFDWVYEEEFDDRDGFRWSPDGTHIAYWQIDASGEKDFLLINDTDSLYPKVKKIPYPKVGTTLPLARVGVIPADGGQTVWADVPGDPRNNYIPRMDWADDSRELVIQHMPRAQNVDDVMLVDAATGKAHTVYSDRDSTWVDVVDDMLWLDGGKRFTWVSEKDGWRHVYVISRDGKDQKLVTPWPFDVVSIELIDDKGGWLYYIASPNNATQRYLYRSRLNGSGKAQRLTPAADSGWSSYQISEDAKWAFQTHASFGSPPTVHLVSLPDHKEVRTLVRNERLARTLDSIDRGDASFFKVDIGDGVKLDGWMMKPPHFDPSKKYPLLFYVYGEPAGQTVTDNWGGRNYLWFLYLTQQGYLVASVDNQGTPAPRGRAWRKAVYANIGPLASAQQAAANRKIRTWDYVDSTRIGIWGWSGGGSMTLNMMFRYPDLYRTGMSVAPVPDQRLYDAVYQERYSGLITEHPESYQRGSPINFAQGLKGNLLLVHGSGDDNVHYQGSEELINRLVALDKPFQFMDYPNRSHCICEGEGTTLHLYSLLTRYLEEHLPAGGRSRAMSAPGTAASGR